MPSVTSTLVDDGAVPQRRDVMHFIPADTPV
jgi:hypothetical protein